MPINSKKKGARAELEFSHWLKENLKCEARRGQQFAGGPDSPDIVCSLPNVHFEVKAVERLNVIDAIKQAAKDAGAKTPIVAHKRNHTEWYLTFRASDLIAVSNIVVKHIQSVFDLENKVRN
jgi:hypothetical protein